MPEYVSPASSRAASSTAGRYISPINSRRLSQEVGPATKMTKPMPQSGIRATMEVYGVILPVFVYTSTIRLVLGSLMRMISHGAPTAMLRFEVCERGFIHLRVRAGSRKLEFKIDLPMMAMSDVEE